ncbi:hypothetical protein IVB56_32025 [Bradyrhizobium sp. CW7]|uniref:hypothetical protein n=1 Tax=Bradyrhizobium sp. CW7 TaxID=2782688 RepID=UPI001FF904D8|nr:hypothetical protein [Bradyrhizobium sp. CW7]MCK1355565.1 hypothetical protein [Bradyrhizobium sp. CW7]
MRQALGPGEKLFIGLGSDYVPVFDAATGAQRLAHVFVACWSIQPHVCRGALVASGG